MEKSTKNEERSVLRRTPIDPPLTGDLFTIPGYSLLSWSAENRFTGKFLVQSHGRKIDIELLEGIATGSSSTLIERQLLQISGAFHGTYILVPTHVTPQEHAYPCSVLLTRIDEMIFHGKEALITHVDAPETSSIPDDGLAPVLAGLTRKRFSGRVFVERRESRKLLQLKRGMITSIASSDPSETLLVVLRRWNYLPLKTLEGLERKLENTESRLRDLIRSEDVLKEASLTEAMRSLHAERILELFSWRSGALRLRAEEPSASKKGIEASLSEHVVLAQLLPDGRVGEITAKSDQPLVLVVTEESTTQKEVAQALRAAAGKRIAGFYFRSKSARPT